MGEAKRRGTREQRIAEASRVNQEAESDDFPTMFWGYDREPRRGELPGETPDDMVCMVSNITPLNQRHLNATAGLDFKLGDWFVSTGRHEDSKVHGPFNTAEKAFDYAKAESGAVRFAAKD